MSLVKNVGEKIRKIREFRNLSQEELADKSRLSKDLISGIENSREMPFLAPLIRIARTLGVRPASLLDESSEIGPVISRGESQKKAASFVHKSDASMTALNFIPLAVNKSGRHMEPYLIDIMPDSKKHYSLSSHEGEEFIYVLSGDVEISYGKDIYTIAIGESIYFDSKIDHHVHSANQNPARILAVVYEMY